MFVVYHYEISDESFIFGIMLGTIVWGMLWYFDAAWCGMTSPRGTKIKV